MSNEFFDTVQFHERTWGTGSYPERPKLQEILEGAVVVFWRDERYKDKYICSIHKDTTALEAYFTKLLFRSEVSEPRRRPVRIYINKERQIVKSVRIHFGPPEPNKKD